MPPSETAQPRTRSAAAEYSYRRPLSLTELVPAIGVAIGAGLFAFYITRILLERTPLEVEPFHARGHSRSPRSTRARELERLAGE
jgi:hypothetical protein